MAGMIVEQRIDADGLYLRLSNGLEFSSSSGAIKSLLDDYISDGNSEAEAKALTVAAIKWSIASALSEECVNVDLLHINFDEATGIPTSLIHSVNADTLSQAMAADGQS